jgi:Sap, sulfolipid-1-addressing protein
VVADLVLIALGIALQPFRLSAFILILSTEGGTKKGLGFILGWLICLVLVIAVVVLITSGGPVRFRTVPSTASSQLAALRNWLDMHGNEVIIVVCLVVGVWLTGQGIRLLAIEGAGDGRATGRCGRAC